MRNGGVRWTVFITLVVITAILIVGLISVEHGLIYFVASVTAYAGFYVVKR